MFCFSENFLRTFLKSIKCFGGIDCQWWDRNISDKIAALGVSKMNKSPNRFGGHGGLFMKNCILDEPSLKFPSFEIWTITCIAFVYIRPWPGLPLFHCHCSILCGTNITVTRQFLFGEWVKLYLNIEPKAFILFLHSWYACYTIFAFIFIFHWLSPNA